MAMRILRVCMIVATASGCARPAPLPPSPESGAAQQSEQTAPRNRDVISGDELHRSSVAGLSVLDAVKSLRPQFLTHRGAHSVAYEGNKGTVDPENGKTHASINGTKVVSVDELAGILANTVKEIRFLNPTAAHHKFGGAAREGPVILVITM